MTVELHKVLRHRTADGRSIHRAGVRAVRVDGVDWGYIFASGLGALGWTARDTAGRLVERAAVWQGESPRTAFVAPPADRARCASDVVALIEAGRWHSPAACAAWRAERADERAALAAAETRRSAIEREGEALIAAARDLASLIGPAVLAPLAGKGGLALDLAAHAVRAIIARIPKG